MTDDPHSVPPRSDRIPYRIEDLVWIIDEVIEAGPSRYIVRGHSTGIIDADFAEGFVGAKNTSRVPYRVMSIDIHTLDEGGKIILTYHVEDWITARQQCVEGNK